MRRRPRCPRSRRVCSGMVPSSSAVFIHIYVHTYTFIFVCMYYILFGWCFCPRLYGVKHVYTRMSTYVNTCLCVCLCICIWHSLRLALFSSAVWIYIYVHTHTYTSVCIHYALLGWGYCLRWYGYIYVYMRIYKNICVYVLAYSLSLAVWN